MSNNTEPLYPTETVREALSSIIETIIETVGPDKFLEFIDDGLLDEVESEYHPIWQEFIDEIIAEQEAAQQYDTEHRQYE